MSGKVVGGGGKGSNGISAIPAASRKMVQSLKEIVNCPEAEIYAMLKECNMDPNEAVNRLLVQDPFHEVKSKREKKKENKDTSEPRSRGASNTSNRGNRGGSDRYAGRSGSTQFSSTESGGKPAYRKENGTHGYTGSGSSTSGMAGRNTNRQTSSYSDCFTAENKMPVVGTVDGMPSLPQPSPSFPSAWSALPGQKSMADIVKMGRPQGRAPPQHNVNQHHVSVPSTAPYHDSRPRDHASHVPEMQQEPNVTTTQHVSPDDEWPRDELPSTASVSSVLEPLPDSEPHEEYSNLPLDGTNQLVNPQLDEVQATQDDAVETHSANHRNIQEDDYEHDEVEDSVSSVAANMEQLNMKNDDEAPHPEEDKPSVVIPNHLQVHTPECSQLSFGSFGSFAPESLKSNMVETTTVTDDPTVEQSENRNEYYGDELRPSDEGLAHRTAMSGENYEPSSSPSEPEVLKQDVPEAAQANQYAFPTSAPGYTFDNAQQLNAALAHSQTSPQMHNLAPFSSGMQAYTNSLPSTLLASTVQGARESDLPYSPFPIAQSMASKYGNMMSSAGGSTHSMPEPLRVGSPSSAQPTQQTLPGAGFATGPTLPQHLAVNPYSQTLPYANMIGYPFLPPQSYTYMPSAFQQAFAGNSTYHQSLAAMLPQYKNSVSVSSLPQSGGGIASGYGFGSSANVPGNFQANPPSAPTGNAVNYDDVMSSQYKDNSHLISLQQNDNSGMWVHGPGSRTMPAVQPSSYYGYQGQNQQQPGAYRQAQQPSQQQQQQQFGGLGYPNFYHSQTGMSLEHQQQQQQQQQQMAREGSLGGGVQGQPSKQAQQLWQNNY